MFVKARRSSHGVRLEHERTLSLMQSYMLTSNLILREVFPMMRLGLEETDVQLIRDAIDLLIGWIKEMSKELDDGIKR